MRARGAAGAVAVACAAALASAAAVAQQQPPQSGTLTRFEEIASVLGDCWQPPAEGPHQERTEITVRFTMRADGSLFGEPRVTHTTPNLPEAIRTAYRRSVMAMLQNCLPLSLSPALGRVVAGRPYSLRLIHVEADP